MSWLVIFGLLTWSLAEDYFGRSLHLGSAGALAAGAFAAILLFASVLLHELGHSWVAQRRGVPIGGITLFAFGGIAELESEPPTPKSELWIAVGGPVVSVVLAAAFLWLRTRLAGGPVVVHALCEYLGTINAGLVLFNMVPAFPLDGGRVLRAILWARMKDLRRATRVASFLGQAFGWILIAVGFYLIVRFRMSGMWEVLIGMFILQASRASYRHVVIRESLSGATAGEAMEPRIVTVPPDLTLDVAAADYFRRFGFGGYPVLDGGRIVGIVSVEDVRRVSLDERPLRTIRDVMRPYSRALAVDAGTDLAKALAQMAAQGIGRLLVTSGDHVVGMLTRSSVSRFMQMRMALGR